MALGAFDEVAALEAGSGTDHGDEVGCVRGPPPLPGGLDELEDHGQGGGRAASARVDLGPQPGSGESRLNRVRGAQVDPVLGGEVVEGRQLVHVVGGLLDGLGELPAVGLGERGHSPLCMVAVLGVVISCRAFFAPGWADFGRAFVTLAIL